MDAPLIQADIDLKAVAHNVGQLRRITRPQAKLLVAVKANAYGHGAVAISRMALANGADVLGVARLDEALELRRSGIAAPILIFGPTPAEMAGMLTRHHLTQAVTSLAYARRLSERLKPGAQRLFIHLKVDTGMGRLGLLPDRLRPSPSAGGAEGPVVADALAISRLPGLRIEGLYTHLATADSHDKTYAHQQLALFREIMEKLRTAGIQTAVCHAANSGAIIDLPEAHLDMVRAGISVYGLYPSEEVNRQRIPLRPVMSLKSCILQLKQIPAGFKVSYGSTWQSQRATVIAVVAVGYADGYNRRLSNRGQMLVHGERASIVGRVCMDLSMLDVGHIDGVAEGDEVVIMGRQGQETISADEIAGWLETINYEVTAAITQRVPRIFIG